MVTNEIIFNRSNINLLETGNLCMHHYKWRRNISSKFSGNSEAFALELQENTETMIPRYYIVSDAMKRFKYLTDVLPVAKGFYRPFKFAGDIALLAIISCV